MLSPPAPIQPQPLFLAISTASQIVINDYDTAVVNPSALKLVNNFLDHLLFNFLAISKSTSMASLRPAVVETLKPKLAGEAIHQADQELEEYLGGGDDEELTLFYNGIQPSGDWDLELVWKRTRLRCMVYSSLGDMEEEDEDHYTELEHLHPTNRYSNLFGVVSPTVAIFLTSILEFMGERAMTVAARAVYDRMRSQQQKDERHRSSAPENLAVGVVVEDTDMERVALDRTLGRLWRGWKKSIRSPNALNSVAPEHQFREINHRFGDILINEPESCTKAASQPRNDFQSSQTTVELEAEKPSKSKAESYSRNVPKSSHNVEWTAGVVAGPRPSSRAPSGDLHPGASLSVLCDVSLIQKTPSGSLTVKAPSLLDNQVSKDSTVPEVIEPETVAVGIDAATLKPVPVPVRSPLRGALRKLTSEALSVQDTQFALTPPKSCVLGTVPRPKSTWTNQVGSADSETSFSPPRAPLRKRMKKAPDTSDGASIIASVFQSEFPLDAHLHPALRSAPPPKSPARVRPNVPVGRDAKSSTDFADFNKSTGPRQSRDHVAVESLCQTITSAHRISAPYVPTVVAKSLAATKNRNRLLARDAVVYGDNLSSSELIDFIRQGPPSEKNHSIPRTVAPCCTTMYSGLMPTALSDDRLSTLPEGCDLQTNFSRGRSINNTKRKIHRVKDPYAINYSDDEEDDEEFASTKGPPKPAGESLIDFLNSVPPPDTFNETSALPPKKTIMARFSRSNSLLARNSSLSHNGSASLKRHSPISAKQFAWLLPSSLSLRS